VETLRQLLQRGVKALILITAGFKETGASGKQAEEEILRLVQQYGARMVGPNCMGIINSLPTVKLNATFVAEHPKESRAAFLSQSGALGAAVLNGLRETDVSFGHFVSVGNKADVNENDLLDYWMRKDDVKALAMYLESFVDGHSFIKKIISNEYKKPLVIVKTGRTAAGSKAASSHTGALASSERVVATLLKQFGIIRAETIDEMFNTLKAFEYFPLPNGNRVAVLTNAGGPAILCVDSLEKYGNVLAELSDLTKEKLRAFVHPEGSVENPVDLLPGGTAEQYKQANEILLADESVDVVVSIFVEPVMVPAMPVIEGINSIATDKPLYQICMPLPEFWNDYRLNSATGKPVYRKPEDVAPVIANLRHYQNTFLRHTQRLAPVEADRMLFTTKEGWLSQAELHAVCSKYDIPLVQDLLISTQELAGHSGMLDYPCVCKGIARGVTHKTEFNLVELNIQNSQDLLTRARSMTDRCASAGITIEAFLIQPYIQTRIELLIGGFRDPSFGPVLMFGSGGKYVEVWNDTVMKSAYLSEDDIDEMIDLVHIGKILRGVRGERPADITAIKRVIRNAAQMLLDNPAIQEFDFNPLVVSPADELFCVDVRMNIG
jgi:acetyltransferase